MKKPATKQEITLLRWATVLGHTFFRGELKPDGTLDRLKLYCSDLASCKREDQFKPRPWDPALDAAYQWDGKKFWRRA